MKRNHFTAYLAGPIFTYGDLLRNTEWAAKLREAFPGMDLFLIICAVKCSCVAVYAHSAQYPVLRNLCSVFQSQMESNCIIACRQLLIRAK